jgi:hypothetical protein
LEAAVVATIRDKSRLTAWLKDQMQAKPNYPISKAEMKNQAKNAGMTVSERSFNGAWEQAVRDTGAAKWSMPGRKSKQRIDTPNNRDGVL